MRKRLLAVKKVRSWIIALLGLWEFGDIAAFMTPGFGRVQAFLLNHIIVGFILMIAGTWGALARNAGAARKVHWIAAAAGGWLVIASFILRDSGNTAGLWNDIIVGGIVFSLGAWNALAARWAEG